MSKVDLPRQLQRQQEEVDRLDREIAEAAAPKTDPPPTETPPVQDGQEPPVPAPTPPPPAPSDDQWEQKFRTLKGKYDAEVPRLHQELRELRTTVQELTARTPKVETPPAPEKPRTKRVTEKDTETFGADLLDVIKRQAEDLASDSIAELSRKLDAIAAENAELKQKVSGVSTSQAQSAQEIYFTKLANAVPDWEAINVSPGFLEWLGQVDELSGASRQAYLTHAFEALNVDRTTKIFNAYKSTLAQPAPQPTVSKQQEVQRQVTPGKSKTPPASANTSDASSKIWTAAEIDEFYRDVRAGNYKTKPQDAARIEAEIDAAAATGRVRA